MRPNRAHRRAQAALERRSRNIAPPPNPKRPKGIWRIGTPLVRLLYWLEIPELTIGQISTVNFLVGVAFGGIAAGLIVVLANIL